MAFAINLPLAAAVIAICVRHVPESRNPRAAREVDLWDAVLATTGLGGVVYALIEGPSHDWRSLAVWAALGLGIAGLITFLLVERRRAAPVLPLTLFRSRNFSGANALTLLLYAALGGALYVQRYSASAAGAALLPVITIMFLLSPSAGKLVDRLGPKLPLVWGPSLAAAGFALFTLPGRGGSYFTTFFPAIVVLGLGMTATVAPLTATVMSSLDEELAGVASGINNAVSRSAALLSIAAFGIIMSHAFDQSLIAGFRQVMWVSAALALASAACAQLWIARPARAAAGERR